MSIKLEIKQEIKIDNHDDAVMFLKDNNWDLSVIPEEQQKEFLSLANKDGQTIAHVVAGRGYKLKDSEILKLTDNNGDTVKAIMNIQSNEMKENLLNSETLNSLSEQRPENAEGHKFNVSEFSKFSLEIPQSRKIELEGYKFKNDNVLTKVQQKCTGINKVNFEQWEQSRNLDNDNEDDDNMGMR